VPAAIDHTIRRSRRPLVAPTLLQLLCVAAGLGLGLLLPRITTGPNVASTRVTESLVAVGFGILGRSAAPKWERVQGLSTASNPSESIDLLTVRLISADFVVNALHEHQEGYNVRSDGGDEVRCGRCYTTTVRR
jgi:hypothetical protein